MNPADNLPPPAYLKVDRCACGRIKSQVSPRCKYCRSARTAEQLAEKQWDAERPARPQQPQEERERP